MTTQSGQAPRLDEEHERSRRAQRLGRIFARWESEELADEPDWDVTNLERLELGEPVVEPERGRDS